MRTNQKHRDDVKKMLACSSLERKESELACRYSSLLQLPYFDAVHMLVIDSMHNLYMGTAKYNVWLRKGIIDIKATIQ